MKYDGKEKPSTNAGLMCVRTERFFEVIGDKTSEAT